MNSEDYRNKIQHSLEEISENLAHDYYCMETELRKEILNKKGNIEKINKETNDIYNILSDEICIKLIKKRLPLRVKIFNKINWCGKEITGNGLITIWFCFNGKFGYPFSYKFYIEDIEQLLKIK